MNKRGIIKLSIAVIGTAAIAAALLLNGTGGGEAKTAGTGASCAENDDKAPLKIAALAGSPADNVQQVAQNGKLRLLYDSSKGLVHLEDMATGAKWYSFPQNRTGISDSQSATVQNPMVIRYTQGAKPTQTFPGKEAGTATPVLIDGGVKVDYALTSIGLHFTMEYRLADDGLDVKVPYDSIREAPGCRLVSLEPVPYFEAGNAVENGYVFVPDGSGAIIRFKEKHLEYFDRYYQSVYGGDYAFNTKTKETVLKNAKEDIFPSPRETIAMPVFGIHRGAQGFAAIVTQGDHDAKIIASPSGYQNVNLYRSSVEFTYRNDDIIFIGDSGEIPMYQGGMIAGDRAVRYVPLQGENSGYVGMAQAYRNYLTGERGVKPVASNGPSLQLQLIGGVVRDEIIGSTYMAMTTFEQAKEILESLSAKGVDSIELTLEGWSDGGAFGRQPQHFPVAGKLGGTTGLEELAKYAESKGIRLYLDANYVKPYANSGAFKESKDVIRNLNREPMLVREPNLATLQQQKGMKHYLLKPLTALAKLNGELDRYAGLSISGLRLDHMGDMLYSDQNVSAPFSRKQTMESWTSALDSVRRQVGAAAVGYGFAYTIGHIDRIDDAPLDSSHFIFEDETVPFYQAVVHGLIPYSGAASNVRDDGRSEFLRMIEYGAMPKYRLSYANSSELKRTPLDDLVSSDYRDWIGPAADEYRRAAEALKQVAGQPIVAHERIDKELYRTRYAGGTDIYVNYGSAAKTADQVRIEPGSFAVRKGGNAK
ncbi:DUF5696 domain-containing protein [Paenibacillus hodogayensis]|uniref:DUF5696 domain-containing protein n=1 Tax=Paenibacillus hodogayensis TaxID=279208 RepID=A0ABV5VYQ5_9BACL